LQRQEVILELTREPGVNLAGVEIILNMREKMSAMQVQIELLMRVARTEPPGASSRAQRFLTKSPV